MNLSETADLLTAMSAFDRRTIGDGDVIAWQSVLSDASFEDCLTAVKQHYAAETDWMMPVHVLRTVREITAARAAAARTTGWAPGQAGVPREEAMPELTGPIATRELSDSVRELLGRLRTMLPEGSREDLMPRRAAWEREHKAFLRARDAEPNPLYKTTHDDVAAISGLGSDDVNPFLKEGALGVARAACGQPGHPVTSHVCGHGGVPYPASYYDTQATAGTHDPDPRD